MYLRCGSNPIAPVSPGTLGHVRRVFAMVATSVVMTVGVPSPAVVAVVRSTPPVTEPVDDSVDGDAGVGVVGGTAGVTAVTLPLVPVPEGCTAPRLPHVVFDGTVVERDYRTVRFAIDRVRAGDPAPYAFENAIDVRYGLDAQYLREGEQYLIGAVVDPDVGLLVSKVTAPIEDFGGDEVIGVSETDVDCPAFDDPLRTLHLDGTAIDAGLLQPLSGAKLRIVAAVVVPFAIVVAVVFVLAMLRLGLAGAYRGFAARRRRRFS